jgi:cell division protein ZapA (FtsZ GTPase activity inhibitor)
MQIYAKKLIQLATIDLLYAQLEVRCGDQQSETMKRIAVHLEEIADHLGSLTNVLQTTAIADSQTDVKKLRSA